METKAEGKVCYTVEQSRSGQWEVNEGGFVKPIASFSSKRDALDYAHKMAQTKEDAEIRVRD
ncbi:MAG TPA: DUF2188 domain-containing protein [Burkholderiales bacterium]|jgi:hypothetical protein|nr:DUF2188 domain-containing protein [Burkholderiales bacterium]